MQKKTISSEPFLIVEKAESLNLYEIVNSSNKLIIYSLMNNNLMNIIKRIISF